ncbi:MAG: hypothetical protein HY958_02980 [Bacteroidia bacterium]|nr:hypothetical protein [Bacteroidia bacterium]
MPNIVELIGFIATAILGVTIVLEMNRLLRMVHLTGAVIFAIYGFVFGSVGMGIVDCGLFAGSLFLLLHSQSFKDTFNILQVKGNNEYLGAFIEYYKRDIYHYSPFYKRSPDSICFLILNNIDIIGVFIVTIHDKKTLFINLDFVVPKYRNFKVGNYLFIENVKYFYDLGYESIVTVCLNEVHKAYLLKMSFEEKIINGEKLFVKDLKK